MKTIQELRKERGWTQADPADRVGVTKLTVSNWERMVHEPKAPQLRWLALAFGVRMDAIAVGAVPAGKAAA